MWLSVLTRCFSLAMAALVTVIAAEYHGEVKFAGLPLPGVTVTATQGDKTLTAATDPKGVYSFADLPDGRWSLRAEKLGFGPTTLEVTAGGGAPGAVLELKMLPPGEIRTIATAAPASAPPSPQAAAPEVTA